VHYGVWIEDLEISSGGFEEHSLDHRLLQKVDSFQRDSVQNWSLGDWEEDHWSVNQETDLEHDGICNDSEELLKRLKGLVQVHPYRSKRRHRFSLLGESVGVPVGGLVELSSLHGGGKTQAALQFLSENPQLRVAWVEEGFSFYPNALTQNGVDLERVLFVEVDESKSQSSQTLWSVLHLLKSQLFEVVVVSGDHFSNKEYRKIQLEAERSQSSILFLTSSPAPPGAWALSLQVWISRFQEQHDSLGSEGELRVEILKGKGMEEWKEQA